MIPSRTLSIILGLTVTIAAATPIEVEIDEWQVPVRMDASGKLYDGVPATFEERTRPRDPAIDGKGRVWFCGQAGNYLAYYEPASETFRRFDLAPNTRPHNLIVDGNDRVWYAGNGNGHIGRLDPASGTIDQFAMPPAIKDPHTLVLDSDGDIWFTAQHSNAVGRLDTVSGKVDVIAMKSADSRPYGIAIDASGTPWIALFGTNAIAKIDPSTLVAREYRLPDADARPRRIAITRNGMIWYVDYRLGQLGRLDPATGAVSNWTAPAGAQSLPYALAADDEDRLWFVESPNGQSRLVGFEPDEETFFSITPLPSGGIAVRHMIFHAPSRTLWFGADSNTIGRARIP